MVARRCQGLWGKGTRLVAGRTFSGDLLFTSPVSPLGSLCAVLKPSWEQLGLARRRSLLKCMRFEKQVT